MQQRAGRRRKAVRAVLFAVLAVLITTGCAVDKLKDLDVIYDLTQQDQIDAAGGVNTSGGVTMEPLPEEGGTQQADQQTQATDKQTKAPESTPADSTAPAVKPAGNAQTPQNTPADGLETEDIEAQQEKMELQTTHLSREELDREDEKQREAIGLNETRISDLIRENRGNYYFEHLDNEGKRLYAELYQITTQRGEKIKVSTMDVDRLGEVYQYLMADHPELFSVDGYVYTRYTQDGELIKLGYTARYLYDASEEKRRSALIEDAVAKILADAPSDSDQFYKAKYVYDYIVNHTEYEIGAPDNQNICSVLLFGRSVCQGYAKTAQLLLNRLGIQTTLVTGTVTAGDTTNGRHAWNMTRVNGREYFMDVTWGDGSFQQEATMEGIEQTFNYDYLLDTTEDLMNTHTIGDLVEMPVCTHLEDNYYMRDGAYFTRVDEEQLKNLFAKAYAEGRTSLTIKCADEGIYNAMEQDLITDKKVFDYLDASSDSAAFALADVRRTITIEL